MRKKCMQCRRPLGGIGKSLGCTDCNGEFCSADCVAKHDAKKHKRSRELKEAFEKFVAGTQISIVKAPPQKPVAEFAEQLADAYSTDTYKNGWSSCIRMMRRRRMTDREIEAVIRSKWTRWAADLASKSSNANSADLEHYLIMYCTPQSLAELVSGTFDDSVDR